jgi:hypothetical protein
MMTDLRYPVGKFNYETPLTEDQKQACLRDIEQTPAKLRAAVKGLSEKQLETPYRPDGWTVRQVTHHIPDSHLNAYVRFKLALTEDEPTIKPYAEDRWARLEDTRATPSKSRWHCWIRCTIAGAGFFVRSSRKTGNVPFVTQRWES